jgi:hypothetical protein
MGWLYETEEGEEIIVQSPPIARHWLRLHPEVSGDWSDLFKRTDRDLNWPVANGDRDHLA